MKTMFKKVGVSAFLLSLSVGAQQKLDPVDPHHGDAKAATPAAKLSATDKDFIIDAAIAGLAEVEMGKLAQEKGVSQGVKDFGAKLVTDHTKANQDLEKTVTAFGVTLPTKVEEEHQRHLDMLKDLTGAQFDAAFSKHMVEGHEKVIALFKKEAKTGEAKALKEFATRTLPTLEAHLKIAKDLAKTKTSAR